MKLRFVELFGKSVGTNRKIINPMLMEFAAKIYGKCPKCSGTTVIKTDGQYFYAPKKIRLQCLNCTFYEDWQADKIYGQGIGRAQKPCPNCGAKWLCAEVKIENAKPFKDYAEVTCKACDKTSYLSLTWRQAVYPDRPLDPFFSRPLRLQTNCADKILWAYNENHLKYLKSYLEADLRDDNGRAGRSMVSRLPKWMTSAKNRKSVLKAIEKLAAELENINCK